MRQPIKLLPCFSKATGGSGGIARFKGLSVNCATIRESWELSDAPGYESIVAEGENAGMNLSDLVGQYGERVVGERIYRRYGSRLPVSIKLVDTDCKLSVEIAHSGVNSTSQQLLPLTQECNREDGNDLISEASECIADGPFFVVKREGINGSRHMTNTTDSFMGMMCLNGEGCLKVNGTTTEVAKGETLLLPAKVDEFDIEGFMTLLTVTAV